MIEKKRESFAPPAVGGISLLVVFAVLCLTVFALLSLTTVRADVRLADASAKAVSDYYAADVKAQEILARLRNGEQPEGVVLSGNGLLYAQYAVPISDTRELQVSVILKGGVYQEYVIRRWKAASTQEWEANDTLELWDGTVF